MRQIYVNGQFVSEQGAHISVFDRGFLFADAVYEVTSVLDGKLVGFAEHMARLQRSLDALDMAFQMTSEELLAIHRELIERNGLHEGIIYLQVTRGMAERDFLYPDQSTPNGIVLFTQEKSLIDNPAALKGIRVVTVDDLRWRRCDIKTVQLLYASMAKMKAKAHGGDDAWLVRDGMVSEGTSNNAYIVASNGVIVTRNLSNDILNGITRSAVIDCAHQLGLVVEERPFTIDEVKAAKEAFITSASSFVMPVVAFNDVSIGNGEVGKVTTKLRQIYIEKSRQYSI